MPTGSKVAESKAQRRFMAMCLHGTHTRKECPNMKKGIMREFAETKESGLPKRKGRRG